MPELLIVDAVNEVQIIEVTELSMLTTGMENGIGGGGNIDLAFFAAHYRNQVAVLGDIDGINTQFQLPDDDNVPDTEQLWYGGSNLIPNVDYTIAGNIVTMLWAPINAGPFVATYFYGLT